MRFVVYANDGHGWIFDGATVGADGKPLTQPSDGFATKREAKAYRNASRLRDPSMRIRIEVRL